MSRLILLTTLLLSFTTSHAQKFQLEGDNSENERRPSFKHPLPEVDTRVALTNRIAALLK